MRLPHPSARSASSLRKGRRRIDPLRLSFITILILVVAYLVVYSNLLSSQYGRGSDLGRRQPVSGRRDHMTIFQVSPHLRRCYDAIHGLADNEYVHELCQKHGSLAQYSKILPVTDKVKLTEYDNEFVFATYCIQNAIWTTKVFIGVGGLSQENEGDYQYESADELVRYLESGEGLDRHQIFYMALPPIVPRNYTETPAFYYYGHNFVIEQLPRSKGPSTGSGSSSSSSSSTGSSSSSSSNGSSSSSSSSNSKGSSSSGVRAKASDMQLPRYLIYSSFAQHFRVVDWLRPRETGVDCEWGGGRLLTLDEMIYYVKGMGALIDELNSKLEWTLYANYLHQELFGVQKFGDHEVREGLPFGSIRKFRIKPDRSGHPYSIFFKKHEFDPHDCPHNAHMMARTIRGYMQGYKPAKSLDITCNNTRNWHHYCDDRPDEERYYTKYRFPE